MSSDLPSVFNTILHGMAAFLVILFKYSSGEITLTTKPPNQGDECDWVVSRTLHILRVFHQSNGEHISCLADTPTIVAQDDLPAWISGLLSTF